MSGLVLASRSTARARLLAEAGVAFTVQGADVDEAELKAAALSRGGTPRAVAEELAALKALAVRAPGELVLGADQTLEVDGHLFDKPASLPEARSQLEALRGRPHQLHAAVAITEDGCVVWSATASATLHLRPFSDAFLDAYLQAEGEALLGCVGAYRLEGLGAQLFDRIDGDYFTVLGLPLLPVLSYLRDRGWLQG